MANAKPAPRIAIWIVEIVICVRHMIMIVRLASNRDVIIVREMPNVTIRIGITMPRKSRVVLHLSHICRVEIPVNMSTTIKIASLRIPNIRDKPGSMI